MDTRKVTLIATIAVIALVAVGIGYAYTAMTTNSTNNVGTEFITISPSADGIESNYASALTTLNSNVEWSTNTISDSKVTYVLANPDTATQVAGYQKVGSIYVLVDDDLAASGKKYVLSVNSTTGLNTTYYTYKLVFGYGTDAPAASAMAVTNATSGTENKEWVSYTGDAATFAPSTTMTKENTEVICMSIYVKPTDSLTSDGLAKNAELPKALNDANFVFTLKTLVTVTFNANGGTGTMDAQEIVAGVSTALTANAFSGNADFAGWATSSDGNVVYANSASVTLIEDTTLYAKWGNA